MSLFEFSAAGEELREFTWSEFADWYLEISKIQISNSPANGIPSAGYVQFVLQIELRWVYNYESKPPRSPIKSKFRLYEIY